MRVQVETQVRGRPVRVVWDEGTVSGDLEIVERAQHMMKATRRRLDLRDLGELLTALELALGERPEITMLADLDAELAPTAATG